MLTTWCSQAEARIAAETRYDWVTNIASVSATTSAALSDVASSLAAIMMINYDMSGFTSPIEAQTMMDVLIDNANKGLIILKDKKTQDFMV